MVKAILFDWHGVLDKVLLAGLLERLSQESGLSVEEIKTKSSMVTREYVLGNLPIENFWNEMMRETGINLNQVLKLKSYVNGVVFAEQLWCLLPKLKEKYKLAILSDATMEKIEVIRKVEDLKLFDEMLFSAEMHLDKSMPKFFELAIERLKVSKEEALFVDDSQKNINFAKSLGLQTYLFTNENDFQEFATSSLLKP